MNTRRRPLGNGPHRPSAAPTPAVERRAPVRATEADRTQRPLLDDAGREDLRRLRERGLLPPS